MKTTVVKSLNEGLRRLMQSDPAVHLIGEDLVDPYGGTFKVSRGLSTSFPNQVHSTPISEAGIAGLSAGMAIRGLKPIVEIMFGDFALLCADQMVNHVAKYRWMYNDQVKVPFILRTPMGGRRGYGPTHSQSTEKHFLGVPGLRVVAVNRLTDPGELLEAAVKTQDPVLFVENKVLYPQNLLEAHEAGGVLGGTVRFDGKDFPTATVSWTGFEQADVTLIGYGGMSEVLFQAARELMLEDEIACEVVVPTHIKPFDLKPMLASAERSGRVLIFEEGTEGWGWGREVFMQLVKAKPSLAANSTSIGAKNVPIGNSKLLEEETLPQVSHVKAHVRRTT